LPRQPWLLSHWCGTPKNNVGCCAGGRQASPSAGEREAVRVGLELGVGWGLVSAYQSTRPRVFLVWYGEPPGGAEDALSATGISGDHCGPSVSGRRCSRRSQYCHQQCRKETLGGVRRGVAASPLPCRASTPSLAVSIY
ncbi:hypothetical protein Taro_046280, partial [Colocasia esculenta]|nr:hypothetical protein [Colocasia esculenta]